MPIGKVKWFNEKKGFGFINTDEKSNTDIFVHYSSIKGNGFKSLYTGDEVVFELIDGARGLQAQNVSKIH
ncbi:MAG: cold shock domain-containing protein [candidate division Zixibacteria bacterium]|nr:cold shock domain-containing protein [candidate division Zixibacteria bacterium]